MPLVNCMHAPKVNNTVVLHYAQVYALMLFKFKKLLAK